MIRVKRYVFFFLLLFKLQVSFSQDLTGTWEGQMANYQFLQLNIVQFGDVICGYSWDHLFDNERSYCMAFFRGNYDSKRREWVLSGYSFIENSGTHTLMRLRLYFSSIDGKQSLEGWQIPFTGLFSFLPRLFEPTIYLRKVADSPSQVLGNMKDCMKEKEKDSITIVYPTIKPPETEITVDTLVTKLTPHETDSIKLATQLFNRKNNEMSRLVVPDKHILLKVYDNAIIDADTISIFYNGRLILSHQPLTEKAIEVRLTLDENATQHELTLLAENLGSIPPNTALVVVLAGNKRYELFASASLTENAVIVFEYKPK